MLKVLFTLLFLFFLVSKLIYEFLDICEVCAL